MSTANDDASYVSQYNSAWDCRLFEDRYAMKYFGQNPENPDKIFEGRVRQP